MTSIVGGGAEEVLLLVSLYLLEKLGGGTEGPPIPVPFIFVKDVGKAYKRVGNGVGE